MLAGEDAQLFANVAQGGAGAITASAHVHTRRFVAMLDALTAGDLARARQAWHPLVPLIEALFAEANPGPLKALLAAQGWCANELRLPMTAAAESHARHLRGLSDALAAAG